MDVIVTYQEDAWNRLVVPNKGSVVLYADGLLNIVDAHGRCWDVRGGVKRVELYSGEVEGFPSDAPKPTP